ncbi:hypothetical protein HMPREF3204_00644 [Gardnerella pickettii]|nr:hypothetical protein HMPREF3204_00644 [Gardnerella pickettii]
MQKMGINCCLIFHICTFLAFIDATFAHLHIFCLISYLVVHIFLDF